MAYILNNCFVSFILNFNMANLLNFNTVCSLVLIASCKLHPKFLLRLHGSSVLQSIIIFNAKSIRKNFLFGCFIGLSTNSYLCFSICFSFSHNVLTPSTITSMPLLSSVSLVISMIYKYTNTPKKFLINIFHFHQIKSLFA